MPKFAPALLNVLFIALVALKTLTFNLGSIEQFVLLIIGAIVTFLVPLIDRTWQGAVKTGTAIAIAVLTALVPLSQQGWHLTGAEWITVVLAGLTALAVELGVYIRVNAPVIAPAAVSIINNSAGK